MNNQKKSRRIRVLQFICPTGFYGAERWILALARHLNPDEIECDLAVSIEQGQEDLEIVKYYQALGLRTHTINMKGRFDFAAISKLAKLIKNNQIDVIHTHGYKSDIIGLLAAKKAGIPCIITPHGFENAKDLKLKFFIWLGGIALRHATVVAPLSPKLAEDCRRYRVQDDKIVYIQNGVDLSEVAEAEPLLKQDDDEKRIGFVGQMISRKNIVDLLDVFDSLHSKRPETRLILLGDGNERSALEQYARSLTSSSSIDFLGFRNDRLQQLKSFDLFVMTSTLEGIPRCLMEAMAAGIPVAAYDIAGIDQLITHNDTGLLAPLGDKQTLEKHWETLLYQTNTSKTLADSARQYVYNEYSAERMAKEYTKLFKHLVNGTGSSDNRQ